MFFIVLGHWDNLNEVSISRVIRINFFKLVLFWELVEKSCTYFNPVQFRTMSSVVIPFSGERHMTVTLMSLLPQYMQFLFAIQHHMENIS